MEKLKIKSKNGYLQMKDLPHDCIFNKVRTGCGATTIALSDKNKENYVIAVPTTELVINKCYPRNEGQKNWDASKKKAGLSPVENLFGIHGKTNSATFWGELHKYIESEGVKKIICTYDKLPFVVKHITAKDYRLLVDEYHTFLKSYSFRDKAIDGVLENYKRFKSFCFMSATPIQKIFKPNALNGIKEVIADWKDKETITVIPYQTNTPYMIAAELIKDYYLKNGYLKINGKESKEAFFFVNSVAEIKKILDQVQIGEDECKIICADNKKNQNKIRPYKISSSADAPKRFNFITSKSFEGVDFHSETGICIVVSNVQNKNTLLSIDMDIPQIAGRIRNKENPFWNKVIHIFNTKPSDGFTSYENIEQQVQLNMDAATERVDELNSSKLSPNAIKQQIKEIEKLGNNSYLKWVDDKWEANDMIGKLQLYNFIINDVIYQSGKSLKEAYKSTEIATTSILWEIAPSPFIKQLTFRESLKIYCNAKEKDSMADTPELQDIEARYPIIKMGYSSLGIRKMRKLRTKTAIEEELKNMM